MRLILWILISVSTLAATSYGYYCFRESQFIAHPAYIEEFKREIQDPRPISELSMEAEQAQNTEDCPSLQNIDWDGIFNNHTWLNGMRREDVSEDTVWTLRLSLLAFLGMEYEIYEVEELSADNVTYHRIDYGERPQTVAQSESHPFSHFQERACGLNRVHPLVYVASDLGQIALELPPDFVEKFMNRAEVRSQLGQRLNKRYRVNINQSRWTLDDLLDLAEQP